MEFRKAKSFFSSRSESEAVAVGKDIGGTAGGLAGGAVGLGAGMVVASLALIPGLGQVFAVGVERRRFWDI